MSCPYKTDALTPIPCWPRDCFCAPNLLPYNNLAKTFGICFFTIPGPLSSTMTTYLFSPVCLICVITSGKICISSHASNELSTSSFTVVDNAFIGLSNPSKCLFFKKNSETETCFCSFASSTATIEDFFSFFSPIRDCFFPILYKFCDSLLFCETMYLYTFP